jgi:hypothetical protein
MIFTVGLKQDDKCRCIQAIHAAHAKKVFNKNNGLPLYFKISKSIEYATFDCCAQGT